MGFWTTKVLAETLEVKKVMIPVPLLTPLRESAYFIREAVRLSGYVPVAEFSRNETEKFPYSLFLPRSNVRVRWYPSPSTDMSLFEEALEEIDVHACLSLGSIARKHGIPHVQVFNPCTLQRIRTKFMGVLHPLERSRAMGIRAFIAVTDATVPLPVASISDVQINREAGSVWRDGNDQIVPT
ncbi:hypothetical protein SCP_0510680 [Sparassis crispa]|uniref:Uncharacterized protein n=1 Tax=Sparassis crispa TaxID=139825 RepID=A0A401GPD2_9APHY|nr:hypothetical protein SCP_0510680 [Sparassis crispa]GBE84009.1 hypothetical protein SCP_0510680 [Sparassis crispa]